MGKFHAVLGEIWALFIDDGQFAVAILIWLAVGGALPHLGLPDGLAGLLLFAGFAALLLHATVTRARRGQDESRSAAASRF